MSQESINVIRQGFEAWNEGDMERLRRLYDPDVIMRSPPGWPEPGPFVGRDAVMRQFSQLRETFDRDSFQPLSEFRATGDRVVVRVDWSGIGSGPESNVEMTIAFTVRKELIFGLEFFWDHDDALEAAGLSE
jgi:ketosteroid isomerase-like protein